MTDAECLRHLRDIKLFCSVQQMLAVDRAAELLKKQIRMQQDEKAPLP